MADLRVNPALDQIGMVCGFRERGEVSAERRYPGDCNGERDDKNKHAGESPKRRACAGMQDREPEQAREEHELTGNPASSTSRNRLIGESATASTGSRVVAPAAVFGTGSAEMQGERSSF